MDCSNLRKIRNPNRLDAVVNNRSLYPPIQIYHPAFATFIRELLDTTATLTPETPDVAREFINVSLGFCEDELRRERELAKSEFWKSTLMGVIGLLFGLESKNEIGEGE